jgi:calcineurin-like phosphoesterase family protein
MLVAIAQACDVTDAEQTHMLPTRLVPIVHLDFALQHGEHFRAGVGVPPVGRVGPVQTRCYSAEVSQERASPSLVSREPLSFDPTHRAPSHGMISAATFRDVAPREVAGLTRMTIPIGIPTVGCGPGPGAQPLRGMRARRLPTKAVWREPKRRGLHRRQRDILFGMPETTARRELRLAVLTDCHVSPPGTPDGSWNNPVRLSAATELLSSAMRDISAVGVDGVIALGDITQNGDAVSAESALTALAAGGPPVYLVPGNHDVAEDVNMLDAVAQRHSGITFLPSGATSLGEEVAISGVGLSSGDGGGTCSAANLPEAVSDDRALQIWATHYPALSVKSQLHRHGLRYPGDLVNRRQFQRAVQSRCRPTLVLSGHVHAACTLTYLSTLQVSFPALVEWPHAWTLLTVTWTGPHLGVRAERHAFGESVPPLVNTLFTPALTSWVYDGGVWRQAA